MFAQCTESIEILKPSPSRKHQLKVCNYPVTFSYKDEQMIKIIFIAGQLWSEYDVKSSITWPYVNMTAEERSNVQ